MKNFRQNLMNVVAPAICLAVVLIFSGCEPDEPIDFDKPIGNNKETSIVGKWQYETSSIKEIEFSSGVSQEAQSFVRTELEKMYDNSGDNMLAPVWEFKENNRLLFLGEFVAFPDSVDYSGGGGGGGASLTCSKNNYGSTLTGQYSIINNKLIFDIDALQSMNDEDKALMTANGLTEAIIHLTFTNINNLGDQWKIKAHKRYKDYHEFMISMGGQRVIDYKTGFFIETFNSYADAKKWYDDHFKPWSINLGNGIVQTSDANVDEMYQNNEIGNIVRIR